MKRTSFHDRVADEATGKGTEEFAKLIRSPDRLEDWYRALVELKTHVEQQLTDRKAELDAKHLEAHQMGEQGKQVYFTARNEFQTWKRGAVRFKQSLEHRLSEAKKLRREHHDAQSQTEKRWALIKWAADLIPNEGAGAEWHKAYAAYRMGDET